MAETIRPNGQRRKSLEHRRHPVRTFSVRSVDTSQTPQPQQEWKSEFPNHFKANLRDTTFMLFEVLGRGDVYGQGPFENIDTTMAKNVLGMAVDTARVMGESYMDDDRHPTVYDPATKTVTLSDGFKRAYHAYLDSELFRFGLPVELEGAGAPPSLTWSMNEFFLAGHTPAFLNALGPPMTVVQLQMGPHPSKEPPEDPEKRKEWEAQRKQRKFQDQLAKLIEEKQWTARMVLTEPDAGSDVGAARTKATPHEDGTWRVDGIKRFITGGEHGVADNNIDYVLARTDDPSTGTDGLSLFAVPKYKFDPETGELGEPNGVTEERLEKKMGLKSSPTTELKFDSAVGYLIGEKNKGLKEMFHVMRYMRMTIGAKAVAGMSLAYLHARDEAKRREQGADITRALEKGAPKVRIIDHAPIRRSLLEQKAYAEGFRALLLYTASLMDDRVLAEAEGKSGEKQKRLIDLFLPLVKGAGSEQEQKQVRKALEIFGGSGYLQDNPLEQYVRDAQIDTIYEGTTTIQSMDFVFRNVLRENGKVLSGVLDEVSGFVHRDWLKKKADVAKVVFQRGEDAKTNLGREYQLLGKAVNKFRSMSRTMRLAALRATKDLPGLKADKDKLHKINQHGQLFMEAFGDLMVGYLLLRQAEVAKEKLKTATGAERDFYEGKIASARYFANNILPQISSDREIMRQNMRVGSFDIKSVPEAAF